MDGKKFISKICEMLDAEDLGRFDSNIVAKLTELTDTELSSLINPLGTSLSANSLIASLGECSDLNEYEISSSSEGRWWIVHKKIGSGEPLLQWLTGEC